MRVDRARMPREVLQGHEPHHDEQRAAQHLAAAFHVRRNRPADQDDDAGAKAEQDGVAGREADRHPERAGATSTR